MKHISFKENEVLLLPSYLVSFKRNLKGGRRLCLMHFKDEAAVFN